MFADYGQSEDISSPDYKLCDCRGCSEYLLNITRMRNIFGTHNRSVHVAENPELNDLGGRLGRSTLYPWEHWEQQRDEPNARWHSEPDVQNGNVAWRNASLAEILAERQSLLRSFDIGGHRLIDNDGVEYSRAYRPLSLEDDATATRLEAIEERLRFERLNDHRIYDNVDESTRVCGLRSLDDNPARRRDGLQEITFEEMCRLHDLHELEVAREAAEAFGADYQPQPRSASSDAPEFLGINDLHDLSADELHLREFLLSRLEPIEDVVHRLSARDERWDGLSHEVLYNENQHRNPYWD